MRKTIVKRYVGVNRPSGKFCYCKIVRFKVSVILQLHVTLHSNYMLRLLWWLLQKRLELKCNVTNRCEE